MPTRSEVVAQIIEAVAAVQAASGRPSDGIGDSTTLIGGLDGFDSLNGIEVLVMVGAALGSDFPDELLGPSDDGSAVSVGDLADRILERLEA